MDCNTFGWTPAALTNRAASSFQKLSTLCIAGTVSRLNAMSICQMCEKLPSTQMTGPGNRLLGKADGSLGAGPSNVCEITRIFAETLRGRPLPNFSIAERMSLTEQRKTTRKEESWRGVWELEYIKLGAVQLTAAVRRTFLLRCLH